MRAETVSVAALGSAGFRYLYSVCFFRLFGPSGLWVPLCDAKMLILSVVMQVPLRSVGMLLWEKQQRGCLLAVKTSVCTHVCVCVRVRGGCAHVYICPSVKECGACRSRAHWLLCVFQSRWRWRRRLPRDPGLSAPFTLPLSHPGGVPARRLRQRGGRLALPCQPDVVGHRRLLCCLHIPCVLSTIWGRSINVCFVFYLRLSEGN